MIRENFIEVKSHAEQHGEATVQACIDCITVLPGRVAVLCDKHVEKSEGGVYVAAGKWTGSQNSDSGTVIGSGYKHLRVRDRVGFLPLHGVRCSQPEFDWVPEGCEIRIFGVACPVNESFVRLVEVEYEENGPLKLMGHSYEVSA